MRISDWSSDVCSSDLLEWAERPAPACGDGEIRIRVAAAGLNRADLLQRGGHYPPPAGVTDILGLECAGVVAEVSGRSRWKVGDRVCTLLAGGGMAEEVVVEARHALPVDRKSTRLNSSH